MRTVTLTHAGKKYRVRETPRRLEIQCKVGYTWYLVSHPSPALWAKVEKKLERR